MPIKDAPCYQANDEDMASNESFTNFLNDKIRTCLQNGTPMFTASSHVFIHFVHLVNVLTGYQVKLKNKYQLLYHKVDLQRILEDRPRQAFVYEIEGWIQRVVCHPLASWFIMSSQETWSRRRNMFRHCWMQ